MTPSSAGLVSQQKHTCAAAAAAAAAGSCVPILSAYLVLLQSVAGQDGDEKPAAAAQLFQQADQEWFPLYHIYYLQPCGWSQNQNQNQNQSKLGEW